MSRVGGAFPNVSTDGLTSELNLAGLAAQAAAVTAQAAATQTSANTLSASLAGIQSSTAVTLAQVAALQTQITNITNSVNASIAAVGQITANNVAAQATITTTTATVAQMNAKSIQTVRVGSGADTTVTGIGTTASPIMVKIAPTVPMLRQTWRIAYNNTIPGPSVTAIFYKLNRLVVCAVGSALAANSLVITAPSIFTLNPGSEILLPTAYQPSATIHGTDPTGAVVIQFSTPVWRANGTAGTGSSASTGMARFSFIPASQTCTVGVQAQVVSGTALTWPVGSYFFASGLTTFAWLTD